MRPSAAADASDQKTTTLAAMTSKQTPRERPLSQARRLVLKLVEPCASRDEPLDRPADQPEQPQFLARRRIDGQPIRVVGIALGAAHLVGVAVAPDGALAQQPVRREPRAGEHERRPPGEAEEHDRRGEAADHADQAAGDEVHRVRQRRPGHAEVEVARDGEVGGERRILQVCHTRRADAHLGQAVVEKRRGAIAEVVADRRLNRRQHLQQDEDDADDAERTRQAVAALDGADQDPHRNGEQRRQDAVQQHDRPPRQRESRVGLRQRREEHPLFSTAEPSKCSHRADCRSGTSPGGIRVGQGFESH